MWIKETETIIAVENLDIWLEIVGTENQETELGKEEDQNIDRDWQQKEITDKII